MVENKRYRTDTFHAKSLENNPLDAPVERDIHIYLPPGYFEEERAYPVIYYLHGYSGNNHGWSITYENSDYRSLPWEIMPKDILKRIDLERITTFEKLDEEISSGKLTPCILVQPDGSLHEPHIDGRKNLAGEVMTKGSFYVNSPFTGNYMDYIADDIINYIDSNYRTIAEKDNRALMGGSMGGYGTLYITLHHPDKFISAVALSPGNLGKIDILDWELRIPIYEEILGEKMGRKVINSSWRDILDTLDLIFSDENRLIPSIERGEDGKIIDFNHDAYENWQQYDLNDIMKKHPEALKTIDLLINCEKNDEFLLAEGSKQLHETLNELNIEHSFEIYNDPKAELSPHILGIKYHVLPGMRFCTSHFKQ